MREEQEGYRPPVTETQVEKPGVSAAEEATMPSVEDLDALLRESARVVAVASMSEEKIDEMVERHQESLERLQEVDTIRASRLRKVENYNPLGDLKPSDYERLVQEDMMDAGKDTIDENEKIAMLSAKHFQEIDNQITKLESLNYPSADVTTKLEKLSSVRNAFREKLESQIAERQQEIATRREEVKSKVLEHYAKRTEELERIIAEIESNPHVAKRLQTMAEKKMKEVFAKREKEKQEAETRERKLLEDNLKERTRESQSVYSRQQNANKRLDELFRGEVSTADLLAVLKALNEAEIGGGEKNTERKRQIYQNKLGIAKRLLMEAIIDGEGKLQLKAPSEVVPREMKSSNRYSDALNELRNQRNQAMLDKLAAEGNRNAQKTLELILEVEASADLHKALFGDRWVWDKKINQKKSAAFWAAFETRKKNDKEGITAARKKEREEAARREAAFKKSTEEIIKRGGFIVEVPVVKEVRGKKEVVGKQKGAIRLEKGKSPERKTKDPETGKETIKGGNEYWRVAEIFGATGGLKAGDVSPLDMRSFPQWLAESAKPYFIMHGKDFSERLIYETEE